ncbi:MAG TPA: sigma-54 dependent transcriptional regulator [Pyrinomonadaceae bacterium]|jgi:DNA-binding NtrC family response regulator|nr:sigma-54 dependent transcriptional regulator [Pyrinomonadaceae bacterium]
MPRVLIADDQPAVIEALRLLLKGEGFETRAVASPSDVAEALARQTFDVALIDLNYTRDTTSGQEGLDLLTRIRELDPTLPVVVMTAWGSVDLAVAALQRGASDFVQKPWDNARLLTILRTQAELASALRKGERLEAENRMLRADGGGDGARPLLIADSPAMRPLLELVQQVGPSDANVLITGENGTGKEVIARTLHALSLRASKTMVTVNAGALAEGTFESELFGHVKGAFTDAKSDRVGRFELADGGTLFLDEIANVPINLQPKLLRVLETGEFERVGSSQSRRVDVRVISATNASLKEEAASGRFRQDLFFRLNTVEMHLPPLRERPEDIDALAAHFLSLYAHRYRKPLSAFDAAARDLLRSYDWPGNVRELDHVVQRAVLLARSDEVKAADLGLRAAREGGERRLEEMSLEEVERLLIQKALKRFGGNVSQAAEVLGLSRSALYRRMQKYEI